MPRGDGEAPKCARRARLPEKIFVARNGYDWQGRRMSEPKIEEEKRRPGRPRKDPAERLTANVFVRMTQADSDALDAITEDRQGFCRDLILAGIARETKLAARRARRARRRASA